MNPFILVVGPTASGKSQLGLELAEQFNGSIMNCDSIQTYQRLNIGAAKPTLDEQKRVPHFLFDVLKPGQVLTAGDFRKMALETLHEQLARSVVVGVGGSGFYIQALLKGMFDVPKSDPQVDAQVREEYANLEPEQMHAELKKIDPDYAQEINANDSYRILRALVVMRDSGKKISDLRREFKPKPFPFPLLKLGLNPAREILLERVRLRTLGMLEAGLVEEVRALVEEGYGDWPALKSVGYLETLMCLKGELTLEQLNLRIVEKTMQLAKKQRTWFKRDTEIHWLGHDPLREALTLVSNFRIMS